MPCRLPPESPTEHCRGVHLNMPIVQPDPATMNDLTDEEKDGLAGMRTSKIGTLVTRKSRALVRKRSATAWPTPPPARPPGFSKNSGRGPIATEIQRTC